MKKILGIILALTLILGLIPVVSQAAAAPTLTGAHPINNTQLLITFSEPVVLNFGKSTRFAMRVIDGNNNMASGTTDAYQTMAEGKYTWANEAHTALIWTIASGTGHPATVAHWEEVAQAQQANGNRVCFAIIDLATSGDANVDAVTAVSSGAVMQKMNTSGAGMAVVEITDIERPTLLSATAINDTQLKIVFSAPVSFNFNTNARFALRVIDENNDNAGSKETYNTMKPDTASGLYTWVDEEHTELIWTIPAASGTTATVEYWQSQVTAGNRLAFCIVDVSSTNADAYIDAVSDAATGATMKRMNTSGSGMAVVEVTVPEKQVAAIGNTTYPTLTAALNAAQEQDVVVLLENTELADAIQIPNGVTLDLNGCKLTAPSVIANVGDASVIDTKEGQGGVYMPVNTDNDNRLLLKVDNAMLALYDSEEGCYRFFTCTVVHEKKEYVDSVKFGIMLNVSDAALELLQNPVNADVSLTMEMTLTTADGDSALSYSFKADTVATYVQTVLENTDSTVRYAMVLSVYGFENLDADVTLCAVPVLATGAGCAVQGSEMAYVYAIA